MGCFGKAILLREHGRALKRGIGRDRSSKGVFS